LAKKFFVLFFDSFEFRAAMEISHKSPLIDICQVVGVFYIRLSKLILKKPKENQIKGNHREICYRYGNDVQQQPTRHAITLSCQETNIQLEVKHKSHFYKKSICLQLANKHLSLTIALEILQDSLP